MKTQERRLETIAARVGVGPRRYWRDWAFNTAEPARRVACFVAPAPDGRPLAEIPEAAFLAATGSTLTNAEIEAYCGQRPLEDLGEGSRAFVLDLIERHGRTA